MFTSDPVLDEIVWFWSEVVTSTVQLCEDTTVVTPVSPSRERAEEKKNENKDVLHLGSKSVFVTVARSSKVSRLLCVFHSAGEPGAQVPDGRRDAGDDEGASAGWSGRRRAVR